MSGLADKYIFLIVPVIFIASGCQNPQVDTVAVRYSSPLLDSCKIDSDHKYFISQPESISEGQKFPLIMVIDPHGDGNLAVEKFSRALEDIPVIIAGSQKIKNNYAGFEQSLSHLFYDVADKYPVDPDKVVLAGFSGGARMAYAYGMRHKVQGILMYGAGPGPASEQMKGKNIYAVSGTRDFNFMEQYLPPFSDSENNVDYKADFFRGKHEWPPAGKIHESVAYILKDEPDFPSGILAGITDKLMLEYDSLLQANDLFFAGGVLEKALEFAPNAKYKSEISLEIAEFQSRDVWGDYMNEFEHYLQKELKIKQAYAGHLADPDTTWWKKEIQSIHINLRNCTDPVYEDFLFRIQGFVGIILYSQINSLLRMGALSPELYDLLDVYEYAEPESPDLAIFKSEINKLSKQ